MTQAVTRKLTLQEFLALRDGEPYHELIDGETVPKVSPKRFHSRTCRALIRLLEPFEDRGDSLLTNPLFPRLELTAQQVFQKAGLHQG